MSQNPNADEGNRIPPQPDPASAEASSSKMQALFDGQPKDEATVSKALDGMDDLLDSIAAGLYSLASMLVGEGEQSVRLVEAAIANAEVSACSSPRQARQSSRRALAVAALAVLAKRTPGCLAAPVRVESYGSCIDEDDLAAAGISSEELEQMIAGPDRDRVRAWLDELPHRMRVVFALRAVAGLSAADTAELLSSHGGSHVAGWTVDAVRVVYRQGLCSLASQLLHASTAR